MMKCIGVLLCLICLCMACKKEDINHEVKDGKGEISRPDTQADPAPPETAAPIPEREEGEDAPPLLSIAEILASDRNVGRTCRVSGRYLGYDNLVAGGPPPRTRSDWQLQDDDGNVIYVSGKFPGANRPQGLGDGRATIVAVVAQDTLQTLGNMPKRVRRYLVRVD